MAASWPLQYLSLHVKPVSLDTSTSGSGYVDIHCWYLGSVSSCPTQQNPANGRAAVGETQNATSSAGPAWLVAWAQVTRSSSCENENCNEM